MKKLIQKVIDSPKSSFFALTLALVGVIFVWQAAIAATTTTINQVPTEKVTANEADFLVMDFNINVAADEKVAGATILGGTAITTTKPGGWTTMNFYDASGGGAWNSGTDWIGTDLDGDGTYNQSYNIISGPPVVDGTKEYIQVEESDGICTNNLTAPTCIYKLVSGTCGAGSYAQIIGAVNCAQGTDTLLTEAHTDWSFLDGGDGVFNFGEFLRITSENLNIVYIPDTTISGNPPAIGTSITTTKPASWSTMSFYDASAGGQWSSGNDWIGIDADLNGYYLDRLDDITLDLQVDSTINPANISNIKFYTGTFGSGTLLGTASIYDGGGSGWYLNGLNRALSAGSNRFYATATLNGALNNQVLRMRVPRYDANNNGSFDTRDSGVFLASSHLGDIGNAAFVTVDTIPPTLAIAMGDNEFKIGDTTTVTFTFSEEVTGFTTDDIEVDSGSLSSFTTSDNITWTATFTPTDNLDYVGSNDISVNMSGLSDLAGNPGVDWTNSASYKVDTRKPTLSITMDDYELKVGETAIITFSFSEKIKSFVLADDATSESGELSDLQMADNIVFTATFTPNENVEELNNLITVNLAGIEDDSLLTKANFGEGTSSTLNYEIDTKRPTLAITMSDYSLIIGETATTTFTFSEAVDFPNGAIGVTSGTISSVATSDSIIWEALFTPAVNTENNTNVVTVDMSQVRDVRLTTEWNYGIGTTTSSNYQVDTFNPSFEVQYYSDADLTTEMANSSYLKEGTYYIKITAQEALAAEPTITIIAEGSANNVTDAITTHVSGNVYKYARTISYDVDAIGQVQEFIIISGSDAAGNVITDTSPTNECGRDIYTDTVAPIVSAGDDKGRVSAQFTQTGTASDGSGYGVASYSWSKVSGHYDVTFGSANSDTTTVSVPGGGPYVLKLTATDIAGNSASDTFSFTWGTLPGTGVSSPGGVGSGAKDVAINTSNSAQNNNIGMVTKQGVNFLTYVNSEGNFQANVSKTEGIATHYITINNLDLLNNIINFTVKSEPQNFSLKLGETVNIDLDGDKISDIEINFANIWVNRAELTIKSIFEPKSLEINVPTVTQEEKKEVIQGDDLKVEVLEREKLNILKANTTLTNRLSGRILLQVEEKGEAWYVEPISKAKHFMGRPHDAFSMMRKFGLGISEVDFAKFEKSGVPARFSGRILLRVETNGEAYYVNPVDMKMYYLGRPADAFKIMRELALGISNENLRQIKVAE